MGSSAIRSGSSAIPSMVHPELPLSVLFMTTARHISSTSQEMSDDPTFGLQRRDAGRCESASTRPSAGSPSSSTRARSKTLSWSTPNFERQHEQLVVPDRIVLLRSRDAPQHGGLQPRRPEGRHEMSNRLSNAATFPAKRPMTEEKIIMKAIVVTDQAAGAAGMKLVERPEPQAAINDVVVQVRASGFTWDELTWPSTWTDRPGRDRTPSIPGHELTGVVSAFGYGTTGLSVGQRVFGLTDWHRDGTLAEYVAVEARSLTPLPGDVDFTV